LNNKIELVASEVANEQAHLYTTKLGMDLDSYVPKDLLKECIEDDLLFSFRKKCIHDESINAEHTQRISDAIFGNTSTVLTVFHDSKDCVVYTTGRKMDELRICTSNSICEPIFENNRRTIGFTLPVGIECPIRQINKVGVSDIFQSSMILARTNSTVTLLKTFSSEKLK